MFYGQAKGTQENGTAGFLFSFCANYFDLRFGAADLDKEFNKMTTKNNKSPDQEEPKDEKIAARDKAPGRTAETDRNKAVKVSGKRGTGTSGRVKHRTLKSANNGTPDIMELVRELSLSENKRTNDEIAFINEGIQAYNSRDYQKALEIFLRSCDQHDYRSCYYIGTMALAGKGMKKDSRKALKYLVQGAKSGCLWSFFQLGEMYRAGDGVPQDTDKANRFMLDLADRIFWEEGAVLLSDPYPEIMFTAGEIAGQGLISGTEKDPDRALDYLLKGRDFLMQRFYFGTDEIDPQDIDLMDSIVLEQYRNIGFNTENFGIFDLLQLFVDFPVAVTFVYKGRLQKVSFIPSASGGSVVLNGTAYEDVFDFFQRARLPDGAYVTRACRELYLFEILSLTPENRQLLTGGRPCVYPDLEREYEEECDTFERLVAEQAAGG